MDEISKKYNMLSDLSDYEVASKVILGAYQRLKEVNPVDYCYQALDIDLECLDDEGEEFNVLLEYIIKTGVTQKVKNIFRLQRKGEAERIQKWKNLPNHLLLFHGSPVGNFMGILHQGLRIAPPEAPVSVSFPF